jgi:hypothetical protein
MKGHAERPGLAPAIGLVGSRFRRPDELTPYENAIDPTCLATAPCRPTGLADNPRRPVGASQAAHLPGDPGWNHHSLLPYRSEAAPR